MAFTVDLDPNDTIIFLVLVGWMLISLLIVISISFCSLYQLFVKDSSNWINPSYRNLTMIIMICFTMANVLQITWTMENYIFKQFPQSVMNIILVIKDIFYHTGNITFYTLLLLRITVPFELNKCIKYLFAFIIFLSALTSIGYIAMMVTHLNSGYSMWRILLAILSTDDLILNLFILIIFVRKSKRTIIDIDPSTSDTAHKNVNIMMNVVAKHSILFGISIFINQGFIVTVFISTFFENGGIFSFMGDYITTSTITLDCTVNVLVLSLVLRANYDKYICLCKYCHLCIAQCCFKNVDRKTVVDNPYHDLLIINKEAVKSTNAVGK